jgi:hypothetical protein
MKEGRPGESRSPFAAVNGRRIGAAGRTIAGKRSKARKNVKTA